MQASVPPATPATGQTHRALGDVIAGLLLLLITWAGLASVRAGQAQLQFDFDNDPGPYLIPELLLLVVGVGGLTLVLTGGWRLLRTSGPFWQAAQRPENAPRLLVVAAFVASMALYLRLLFAVGFRPATFVLCAAWVFLLSRQTRQQPLAREVVSALLTGGLVTVAVYFVFKNLVRVPLP